jgi:hypothetical protein
MNDIEYSENGFIYIASKEKLYYELALLSAESLRTFHRKAHITLFTHKAFVDDRAMSLFDNIITGIPVHARAKMWCMARTPYQNTFYNDVDSQIVSSKIKNVFDELSDCDMFFTESYWYTTGNYKWSFFDKAQQIPVVYHGAVCCYRKTDLTINFMQTWFDEYIKQRAEPWKHDFAWPEWKQFDMFTLWKITSGRWNEFDRFKNLKIKLGPKIYNATIHDGKDFYDGKRAVVYQIDKTSITGPEMKDFYVRINEGLKDERSLPKEPAANKNTLWYN